MTRALAACLLALLMASAARADEPAKTDLAKTLDAIVAKFPGKICIGFKHLPSGETYFHNGDEVMRTASLCKLPVMVEVFYQVKEGKVKLSDPVTMSKRTMTDGSGILNYRFSEGATFPLIDAVKLMITVSDNTATNLVVDKIGIGSTWARMKTLGFPETAIHSLVGNRSTSIAMQRSVKYNLGSTTAREMVGLLEMLNQGKLVDEKSSKEMIAILRKCEDRTKFTANLPPGVVVAHKTGALPDVRTDAGLFFFPGGPVALCVLTDQNKDRSDRADSSGNAVCAQVARAVVDYFKAKYQPAK